MGIKGWKSPCVKLRAPGEDCLEWPWESGQRRNFQEPARATGEGQGPEAHLWWFLWTAFPFIESCNCNPTWHVGRGRRLMRPYYVFRVGCLPGAVSNGGGHLWGFQRYLETRSSRYKAPEISLKLLVSSREPRTDCTWSSLPICQVSVISSLPDLSEHLHWLCLLLPAHGLFCPQIRAQPPSGSHPLSLSTWTSFSAINGGNPLSFTSCPERPPEIATQIQPCMKSSCYESCWHLKFHNFLLN